MEQEQLYAAVIVIGVIFSILTNVALYYYGEAKDLKRKVNQGEYLYVRGEDWIEREIRKHHDDRLTQLENRIDNLVSIEFDNRVELKNDLFVMRQEVDLIKFAKGINQDGFVDRIKKLEDEVLKNVYRLNKIESDEDIVRREFLFGKLRDTDRRIVKVEDELKKWMGVSDGSEKR
jgi:hypothetical protein